MSSETGLVHDEAPARKQAEILPEVHEIFRQRWSPRSFSDRPVTNRDLRTILEAARWAASSYNEQPWRFIVARKSDGEIYQKVLGVLLPFNQAWAKLAPVLVITAAKRTFTHNGTKNAHSLHDAGAALAHIALQAAALELQAHGMAGLDFDKARQELGIPDDYEAVGAVAIGYPGPAEELPEPYRGRELATRERKPLEAIVFGGRWDEPLKF